MRQPRMMLIAAAAAMGGFSVLSNSVAIDSAAAPKFRFSRGSKVYPYDSKRQRARYGRQHAKALAKAAETVQ